MYHPSPTWSARSLSLGPISRRAGPLARARARTSRRPRRLGYPPVRAEPSFFSSLRFGVSLLLSHRSHSPSLHFFKAAFWDGRLIDPVGARARRAPTIGTKRPNAQEGQRTACGSGNSEIRVPRREFTRRARCRARAIVSPPATTILRQFQCRSAGLPSVNSIPDCVRSVRLFVDINRHLQSLQSRGLRNVNDPSAGSPTETLLRLLLPLNDQVWSSSRQHRQCRDIAAHQSEDLTKSFNR